MSCVDVAYKTMGEARAAGLQAGKGVTQIAADIEAAYSFGERKQWPYKAWLKARKEFFARHGLPLKTRRLTGAPENGCLF
jgi:hypothetical protein